MGAHAYYFKDERERCASIGIQYHFPWIRSQRSRPVRTGKNNWITIMFDGLELV
jgi:hypothetical protein